MSLRETLIETLIQYIGVIDTESKDPVFSSKYFDKYAYYHKINRVVWALCCKESYKLINDFLALIEDNEFHDSFFPMFFNNNKLRLQSTRAIYISARDEFYKESEQKRLHLKDLFLNFFERKGHLMNETVTIEKLFKYDVDSFDIPKHFFESIDYDSQPFGEILKKIISELESERNKYKDGYEKINKIYDFFDGYLTEK